MRWIALIAAVAALGFVSAAQAEDDGDGDRGGRGGRRGAAGQAWNVTEGAQGQIKGVWQVVNKNGHFTGNARMALGNGLPLTYRIDGDLKDGAIVIHRFEPSDNNQCDYRGTVSANGVISGTTFCGGNTSIWSVLPAGAMTDQSQSISVSRRNRRDD